MIFTKREGVREGGGQRERGYKKYLRGYAFLHPVLTQTRERERGRWEGRIGRKKRRGIAFW